MNKKISIDKKCKAQNHNKIIYVVTLIQKKMSFLRDFSLEHQHFNIPDQFYLFIIILKGNNRLKLYIQSLM